MTPEEYRRAGNLFEQIRDLDIGQREAALRSACHGNTMLQEEVVRLLEADRDADQHAFLTRRALQDAAELIAVDTSKSGPRLAPGSRLGPYEITGLLGMGGMGEVYRGRDLHLNREVAIKLLASELAGDVHYMERFEHEAKVLASLNHPNIATVYGLEQGALVMELVEGGILQGPVPLQEAIPILRQIAAGLEAAHERGIVHRDLKPANIKITPEGAVKLLDFGLAKSASAATGAAPGSETQGFVLGTAAYMAPEQALGKAADKRADIWAFGVVGYELLTGSPLFGRATAAGTLAAVVRGAPDLGKLPAGTPPHVRRLLDRCLRKDVTTRLRDIGEARVLLDEPDESPPLPPRRWMAPAVAPGLAAAALLVAAFGWLWQRRPAEQVERFKLAVPPPTHASFSLISVPAISPDGHYLAFTAASEGKTQLWIRNLDALEARPVPETEGAVDPFWSPDSRSVAFFVPGKLKKVAVEAGLVQTICAAADGRGGTWNRQDVIVFAPNFGSPLFRVAAAGGHPEPLAPLAQKAGETSHRFPWFLPDGRHFLFTVRNANPEKNAIYLGDLQDRAGGRRLLVAAASNAVYAPPGFLLFLRERTLLAQSFDARRLKLKGAPFPIADRVDYLPGSAQGQFSVSQTGVLAYYPGGSSLRSQLTWFDRSGKAVETVGGPAVMQAAALSPDGTTIAFDRLDERSGTYDLWLHDLALDRDSRLTFDPGNEMYPVWSRDGKSILFSSDRTGRFSLYRKAANGSEKGELLYQRDGVTVPTDVSGTALVLFTNTAVQTGNDVWSLSLAGGRRADPLLRGTFSESHARLSPDGRWLAYESDESGLAQVYVQPFPRAGGKWQVSAQGGSRPLWSREGKELFYLSADGTVMALEVRGGAGFQHRVPKPLFRVRMPPAAPFEISADGKRFLILRGVDPDVTAPMTLVVNWNAGLRQ